MCSIANCACSRHRRLHANETKHKKLNMTILQPARILHGHRDTIRSMAFSNDGLLLATLSILNDKSLIVWDTVTWSVQRRFYGGPGTTEIYFSLDSETIIGTGVNREVRFWNIRTGEERTVPVVAPNGRIRFDGNGNTLLFLCINSSIEIHNFSQHEALRVITAPKTFSIFLDQCGWVNPDGTKLGIEDRDHSILVWSIDEGCVVESYSGFSDSIVDLHFLTSRSQIIGMDDVGQVNVWTGGDAQPTLSFSPSLSSPRSLIPNSETPIVAVISSEDVVEIWSSEAEKNIATLTGNGAQITGAFSPGGRIFATGGDDSLIRIWAL